MATKTGRITSKFLRMGASHSSSYVQNVDGFLAGNSSMVLKYDYGGHLYGLNFLELNNLANVRVTGFSIDITSTRYSGSHRFFIDLSTNFLTSGTGSSSVNNYTSITSSISEEYSYSTGETGYTTITHNDLPTGLTWINTNLSSFINGYNSNSFGMLIKGRATISSITFTIDYTYEETTYTVSTSVTPEGAGTVSPSSQEVESGATASVTAIPNEGYRFSHWLIGGANSGITTLTLSGTITADILCTAVFEKLPPEFTAAEMIYSGNQISNSNKVIAGESFVISVGVT